jgi:hypothetical protein
MVQGPCALEISAVVLDRLNVIIDRLNAISSGSVVHEDAKVCFQGDHLAAIFEVRLGRTFGRNIDCT